MQLKSQSQRASSENERLLRAKSAFEFEMETLKDQISGFDRLLADREQQTGAKIAGLRSAVQNLELGSH